MAIDLDVLLVNMPFSALFRPSIGLSLLQAELKQRNISVCSAYFSVRFAEQIGAERYIKFANQPPTPSEMIGEWIFSTTVLAEKRDSGGREYLDRVLIPSSPASDRNNPTHLAYLERLMQEALEVRAGTESFLLQSLEDVLQLRPKVVGFTSVFQQHVSSLALAKRIKERAPEIFIVFGGSNCEGIMGAETVRQFPFVDAAVSGEGDLAFPEIVARVLDHRGIDDIQGVFTRENCSAVLEAGKFPVAAKIKNMDDLPYPDYRDYFAQLLGSSFGRKYGPQLLLETSRGCWWGERSHCTFCGLSDNAMAYRSKSADRALTEIEFLAQKYPVRQVTVVDNILDMKYFRDFLPELASRKLELELFYEMKANLKKQQVRILRDAGITQVQPGIESFSTPILKLMGKGVSALQNIQLLKWCKEFGIHPYWNLLFGFPGEDPADYATMAELLPLLVHLPKPESAGQIALHRFSPNFERAAEFGFTKVSPYSGYSLVYRDLPEEAIRNLAYYFTYDYCDPRNVEAYTADVWQQVCIWWKEAGSSDLFFVDKNEALLIWDFRSAAKAPLTVLSGIERDLYLACDAIKTEAELSTCVKLIPEEIRLLMTPLLERGVLLREKTSYLSLAVPLGTYQPSAEIRQKLALLLRAHGRKEGTKIIIPLTGAA